MLTPDGLRGPLAVQFDGGRIAGLVEAAGPVTTGVVAPGFIDLQVNGIGPFDVATAAGADWDELDRLLLAQGVTAWCPTLVTAPLDAYAARLERVAEATARPVAGRPAILGVHLEGPFLGGAPGAHRREHLAAIDLEWLAQLPEIVRIVTLAPELPGAVDAIRLLRSKDVVVSIGHSTATYEQAEAAIDAGATLATHLFNGMGGLHHRQPGIAGAVLADDRVATSMIADLVHLHPAVLRTAMRAKGPDRAVLVTDAVAWQAEGAIGSPARLRVVDGAPRLADGTLAGSALTMAEAVANAVGAAGIPLDAALRAATSAPARVIGDDARGVLRPGARGDVVLLDDDLAVRAVWVGGEPAWP